MLGMSFIGDPLNYSIEQNVLGYSVFIINLSFQFCFQIDMKFLKGIHHFSLFHDMQDFHGIVYGAKRVFFVDEVLCIFRITIVVLIVCEVLLVPCKKRSASLSNIFHVTIWTSQFINAAFIKFCVCGGRAILCMKSQESFNGVVCLIHYFDISIFENNNNINIKIIIKI